MLTLLHPASGQVRVKGVLSSPNAILHPWLQEQLGQIVSCLPAIASPMNAEENRANWERWRAGLSVRFTLMRELPPLRGLLILDNLAGHKTPAFVCWLMEHGIMPLYTPISGSWLNMAESVQRIVSRRALSGQEPENPEQIIEWLEATARGWNKAPTRFEWGGKRATRRLRARERRHALGGSGAMVSRSLARYRRREQPRYGYTRDK